MIHLDTNFLIDALVTTSSQSSLLSEWIESGSPIGISAVAWGEFLCGPNSQHSVTLCRRILPIVEAMIGKDAELAAELFNKSGRRSKSYADCCIAAVAIRCNASLASGNRTDFEPLVTLGLKLL
ncbi:MAG: PIN domain-containing protein [Verrucomicrobia bacterium]|nr:PIN domain-containing protein [Verrucomicrobiota bacterium]